MKAQVGGAEVSEYRHARNVVDEVLKVGVNQALETFQYRNIKQRRGFSGGYSGGRGRANAVHEEEHDVEVIDEQVQSLQAATNEDLYVFACLRLRRTSVSLLKEKLM